MRPEYRFANRSDLPALRALWQQAFHDSDSFLDRFFHTAFSPARSRLAAVDGVIAAALYWFPASCRGQSLAYLYAVATAPPFQGKGLCTGLMENTRALLDGHGMGGIVLVPGSPSLFSFYGRMGYTPCCPQGRIQARAGGPALPLKPVSPRRYGELRPALLPAGGVLQEGIPLEFQAELSRLYAGKGLILSASIQADGTLLAQELLCREPAAAAPRILKTLKAGTGVFRIPDPRGRPFAMFRPLSTWQGPPPTYFGLAFDEF